MLLMLVVSSFQSLDNGFKEAYVQLLSLCKGDNIVGFNVFIRLVMDLSASGPLIDLLG